MKVQSSILKSIFLVTVLVVLGVGIYFAYSTFIKEKDPCADVGVMYLTPAERDLIPGILERNKNVIVIIPEEHEIRGNSETLLCPNLNLNMMDYLE